MLERDQRAGRHLRRGAIILAALVVLAVGLIAAGTFDPQPLGPLWRTDRPGRHELPGAGETFIPQPAPWSPEETPPQFSVRLTAANAGGEPDSGYGLALGDGANGLFVAVSPLGYAALWEARRDGAADYRRPWQVWPHVRPGQEANELWLDVAQTPRGAAITVRINREMFWQGEIDTLPRQVGLWGHSFGGPAGVDFQKMEWFAEPDS